MLFAIFKIIGCYLSCRWVMSLDDQVLSMTHSVLVIISSEPGHKWTRLILVSAVKQGMAVHKDHGKDFHLWLLSWLEDQS